MTHSGNFAAFAAFAATAELADFSPEAARRALDAITDCLGCMVAGRGESLAEKLLRVLPNWAPGQLAGTAPLIGAGRVALPTDSALFNGAIAHALDYDDTNHPAYAHPTAVLLPTILAIGGIATVSGADALAAYIVGFEMFGKLGRALNTHHYARGWHTTNSFGTLAAAAAAARLLRLSPDLTARALSIATTSASGLRVHFGTMVKPLHAGLAARNGVLAALLAREDFTAAADALDHRYGFASVFNAGEAIDLAALAAPADPLEILTEFGLALKPFPSCGATHSGIEAALLLHRELAGRPIRRIRAGVSEMAFKPLIHVMPATPLEGKFSLHYCLAAALATGEVGLKTFRQELIDSPAIRTLIERTDMAADDRVRHDPEFATAVQVETEDGTQHEKLIPLAIGKPARWFTEPQLRRKFMDCCAAQLPSDRADDLYATIRGLPFLGSVAELAPQLAGR
jgi:2-methylcitrate dehydratase PrpD